MIEEVVMIDDGDGRIESLVKSTIDGSCKDLEILACFGWTLEGAAFGGG